MLIFIIFWLLFILHLTKRKNRQQLKQKSQEDWGLDGIGLLMQGGIIPLLQVTVIYMLYSLLFPQWQNSLTLSPLVQFLLSFIAVDYLYYWNHRLLHQSPFWSLHQVHHTLTDRDILGTSRNTLWTSFFILYLWIHGLFIYVLDTPKFYLLGVSLTAILDLWRHSDLDIPSQSKLYHFLAPWLILPCDHAWHHSPDIQGNYAANFKIWDRLHGTDYNNANLPQNLGIKSPLSFWQKLLLPLSSK
ncbi:sterol desaturase family protein [Spirulina sp. CS-785/01]|uniref:sterol desaturase family protein n=1 Tax=Spirulina sp. CS-785/01 TaxID=3021716 RepID=UPI0023308C94|nr:sterol desaturase family protein [Spirulina sp. CS-785/01]MDB9314874.1 sterol desaturase family protein [Spirulina sp. CS-785/01]